MILTDASALVALLDRRDANHALCLRALRQLRDEPMLTTWPPFTEAMYILGNIGGFSYQDSLWQLVTAGHLVLHDLTAAQIRRTEALMRKYHDTPMDLADASLVTLAESQSLRQVFSLDSDFQIYRLADGTALQLIP